MIFQTFEQLFPWKTVKKNIQYPLKINGITADVQGRLKQLNLYRFEQIATLSDEDMANVDEALNLKGAIEKQDWVGQAQRLMAESTASEVPADEAQG